MQTKYYVDSKLNVHSIKVIDPWRTERTPDGYELFWIPCYAYQKQEMLSMLQNRPKGKDIVDDIIL